jgi:DnaJ domain
MGGNLQNYRDSLYRLRSHPDNSVPAEFRDRRDSSTPLYLSLIPFLILEYWVEELSEGRISALLFPTGYLLFWAFFFTYYRPGVLEENMGAPRRGDLRFIPALILGVAIWFVKVTVVELSHLLFLRWIAAKPAPKLSPQKDRRAERPDPSYRRTRPASSSPPPPPRKPPSNLPGDVRASLAALGLGECRDWNEIHHRYRELAKKYHPDLNREITQVGNRFMGFDKAYRHLMSVKEKYFIGD